MIFKTTKLPALLKPKVVEVATTGVLARAAEGLSAARPGSRDLFGPQGELATGVFTKAGAADSEAISEAIAESLLTKVVARAELRGSGVEVYGRGDAELIRRRKWVDQLDKQKVVSLDEAAPGAAWLAEDRRVNAMLERAEQPNVGMPDAQWSALRTETAQMLQAQLGKTSGALLHPFGPAVKTAVEALKTTSTPAGDLLKALTTAQEQVAAHPAGSAMVEPLAKATDAFLWRELGDAVAKSKLANDKAAVEAATALKTGAKKFVEADPQALSTAVLKELTDPEQRARSLADLLLQFRAPEDISGPKKRLFAGGEGIQAVAELRQNTKSVTSAFGDPKTEREYALMRAVTLANPRLSSNAVLEARHVVSKLRRMSWELVYGPNSAPKGHETAPYAAIHHNFSANTPAVIDSYVRNTLFAGGDPEHFVSFVDAMNRAKDMKTPAEMAAVLSPLKNLPEFEAFSAHRAQNPSLGLAAQLEGFLASKVKGVLDSKSADDPNLSPAERENLRGGGVESVKGEYAEKLSLSAQLFRAVCKSMPNAESLAESLFDAGGARPEVAKAIAALSEPDAGVGLLDTLVSARGALRTEFDKTTDGSARLGLWKLDGQLERLIGGELGKRVSAPEGVSSVEQNRADAMAMRAAVESSRLSGLDQMRVIGGSNAQAGTSFAAASAALSQVIDSPTMRSDAFRQAMGVAQASVVDSVDNIFRVALAQQYRLARLDDLRQARAVRRVALEAIEVFHPIVIELRFRFEKDVGDVVGCDAFGPLQVRLAELEQLPAVELACAAGLETLEHRLRLREVLSEVGENFLKATIIGGGFNGSALETELVKSFTGRQQVGDRKAIFTGQPSLLVARVERLPHFAVDVAKRRGNVPVFAALAGDVAGENGPLEPGRQPIDALLVDRAVGLEHPRDERVGGGHAAQRRRGDARVVVLLLQTD